MASKKTVSTKKPAKKILIVKLWEEYLKTLSSSEISAIKEKGDAAVIPGFLKFLSK